MWMHAGNAYAQKNGLELAALCGTRGGSHLFRGDFTNHNNCHIRSYPDDVKGVKNMKKTVVICDCCGIELNGEEQGVQIVVQYSNPQSESMLPKWSMELPKKDFCPECAQQFVHYLLGTKERVSSSPAAKGEEEQEIKRRTKIDVGKVLALKKAGWSVKNIAEEMHVSTPAIYNVLAKKEKKEANE